jgi:hypothetical protein
MSLAVIHLGTRPDSVLLPPNQIPVSQARNIWFFSHNATQRNPKNPTLDLRPPTWYNPLY